MYSIYINCYELFNFNQLEIIAALEKYEFIILAETYFTEIINEQEICIHISKKLSTSKFG